LIQPLAPHEERGFEDGEHKVRPLTAVQNADVYVVQSLHSGPNESANDKLCRLLFFIGALKDAGAARVTTVVPYLCISTGGTLLRAARAARQNGAQRVIAMATHGLFMAGEQPPHL
jgi:phosphoribosylpyrophosphate synthetase